MARTISILGSTGSIGCNTLDVIGHMGGREAFDVVTVTGASNVRLLAEQAKTAGAKIAVTADDDSYGALKDALAGSGIEAAAGRVALIEAASRPADITMAAIVGIAGLEPTLAAVRNGGTLALANKESLVSAGHLFTRAVREAGATLLPVDSEHNAIFQVLEADSRDAVERVILTASGGPFRTYSREQMALVTVESARAHPNWSMGLKISIDSATMFNKALETIEAKYLFDLQSHQIEVLVHPQSIIHSMVGYSDGSLLAQLGPPDMRTAIGYCLAWPERVRLPVERLDFVALSRLDFEAPDEERFPSLGLARNVLETGGLSGAVLNGAKEATLEAFVAGHIGFLAMSDIVGEVMVGLSDLGEPETIGAVIDADRQARMAAGELIAASRQ